ncbi:MAG: AAA family ATPase [Chloroflexi bacterium]|nr:AAA family ATPase [Chloroflexota bacterium]
MEALDLAAQALAADPGHADAATIVGTARRQLAALSASSAELRQITVVVIDLYRSTTIAARLGPELMRELMLELYEVCIDAVTRYEGKILKYLGDGVMAQFGYPVAHEDDARRAVLSALTVLEVIDTRRREWEIRFGEPLVVRIGVDSGAVAVGPVAAGPWAVQELAGDPPNVATRVQATAEHMTVRVTDATHQLIKGWFETEPVGAVELRNYPQPVVLHHVVRPTDAQTRAEARRLPRPPLLGRDAELGLLRSAWERVRSGDRQVVTLTGEAGIGKSRIVEQLVGTATATGALHLTFSCSPLHAVSPLRPVASALTRFFDITPQAGGGDEGCLDTIRERLLQLPDRRTPIERALPLYASLLGIGPTLDRQPDKLRRQTFDALVDLFHAMASSASLLLCVEDIDTADPSTVELLRALLDHPPAPMLVLLTSRKPLPALGTVDAALVLKGLSTSDAAAVVRSIAPDVDDESIMRMVARCDGLPFVLEEQARALRERSTGAFAETGELSMFLAARLDELGPRLRRLIGEIAVAGEEVRLDVVRRLSDLEPAELDQHIADLCRQRVLLRLNGPTGESVRFRHVLLCDAAYGSLLEVRRASLHGRVADILTDLSPAAAAEDIAHHYEVAGAHKNAAEWWLQAARNSANTGALVEAISQFRRSLSALTYLPDNAERVALELDVQFRLGTALSTATGYTSPEALDAFQRAVKLGESLEDSTRIFGALWGTWTYWFVLGEHGKAAPLASRCRRIGQTPGVDPRFRWTAAGMIGYHRLFLGDFTGARDQLLLASEHVGLSPVLDFPNDLSIASRCALAVVMWFLGDADASRQIGEDTVALAAALDPADSRSALTLCWANCWLAWRAELDGDSTTAIELATEAAAIASQHGYTTWIAGAMAHGAIAYCRLGHLEDALPALAEIVDGWRSAGRDPSGRQLHPVLMTPYFAGRLIEAQVANGELDGALEGIDLLLAESARSGERFWDGELHRLRSVVERLLDKQTRLPPRVGTPFEPA